MIIDTAKIDKLEVFLPEDMRLINKTLKIREDIIDNLTRDGVPTDSRSIRVMNEVLNSIDALTLGRTDRILKKNKDDEDTDMKAVISNIYLELSKNKSNEDNSNRDVTIDGELKDDEIVDGEDSLERKEITKEDIFGKGDEE